MYWEEVCNFIGGNHNLLCKDHADNFSLDSFAYSEMSSCLAKIIFKYELELVDKDLDWEAQSRHYIMWWKAPICVRAYSKDRREDE